MHFINKTSVKNENMKHICCTMLIYKAYKYTRTIQKI